MGKTNNNFTELRVQECPVELHTKIEKYISITHIRDGRKLTKADAAVELLEQATKKIK